MPADRRVVIETHRNRSLSGSTIVLTFYYTWVALCNAGRSCLAPCVCRSVQLWMDGEQSAN